VTLGVAVVLFVGLIALRYAPFGRTAISIGLGIAIWVATLKSDIDPVISGVAVGLATSAYPPARQDLERATALTRSFREQPTPKLARSAQQSLQSVSDRSGLLLSPSAPGAPVLLRPRGYLISRVIGCDRRDA
jgi:Na+/H+ antiporter NhaA